MIGKFVSKALLSVVMDKSARDRLDAVTARRDAAPRPPASEPGAPPQVEDTQQLVADSLAAAEQELAAKPKMTGERRALIRQALALQKSKAHVLDDLSAEQREKLYAVAMTSLGGDPRRVMAKKGGRRGKGGK